MKVVIRIQQYTPALRTDFQLIWRRPEYETKFAQKFDWKKIQKKMLKS